MCQIWYATVKANRSYRLDMKTWQKPIKLRSKVNIQSGSWMNTTHRLKVIHPCAQYGNPMSNQTNLWAGLENMSKTLLIWPWGQSSRSSLDHECTRHNGLWWYTHVPDMVRQCKTLKSYGPDTNLHRKTDGRTDRQTEWFLYTPLNFVRRGYNNVVVFMIHLI